jgi:hypothetical protein
MEQTRQLAIEQGSSPGPSPWKSVELGQIDDRCPERLQLGFSDFPAPHGREHLPGMVILHKRFRVG